MIKFMVMDVDGTLTDGKIYMGNDGEIMKAFCAKDGYGICHLLKPRGIRPVIITGRKSVILENRCRELNITEIYQNVQKKTPVLEEVLRKYSRQDKKVYSMKDVAYIGDDLNDYDCMMAVKKEGGLLGCPADAAGKICELSDYICQKTGGNGAVREFIEWCTGFSG